MYGTPSENRTHLNDERLNHMMSYWYGLYEDWVANIGVTRQDQTRYTVEYKLQNVAR